MARRLTHICYLKMKNYTENIKTTCYTVVMKYEHKLLMYKQFKKI